MDKQLFNLERWDAIAPLERKAIARELSQNLPAPWQFAGIKLQALGDREHYVAFFDWNGAAFALIPGCEATLGYDRDNPFILNEAQRQDWNEYMKEWYSPEFDEYMDEVMAPLRTVTIEPFLIEVKAADLGLANYENDIHYRSRISHRAVRQLISADGLRLPTSDEWEYACAAGSRTLWRWGNDYPLHCYPNYCTDWDLNLKPNAFGLEIACDPYDWEFCAEPGIIRGGDGGAAICGAIGFTPAWLTLASAFVDASGPEDDSTESLGGHLRRAYSLPL